MFRQIGSEMFQNESNTLNNNLKLFRENFSHFSA